LRFPAAVLTTVRWKSSPWRCRTTAAGRSRRTGWHRHPATPASSRLWRCHRAVGRRTGTSAPTTCKPDPPNTLCDVAGSLAECRGRATGAMVHYVESLNPGRCDRRCPRILGPNDNSFPKK
jgi:hypothetical protein